MLARDYSQKRTAFGKQISKYPLHMQVLSRMEVEVRGSLLLLVKVCNLNNKIFLIIKLYSLTFIFIFWSRYQYYLANQR